MEEREKKKQSGEISRREFLKDAGLIVGGTAIGSTVLLAACGGEGETATQTVTQTQTATKTVTTTQQVGTATTTVTQAVSKFVCPYDGQEFTSLSALQAHVNAEHAAAPEAEGLITLNINGGQVTTYVEPNWSLQWVLNDRLGLTGAKDWCNQGACGSCTVIMDGRSVLACMTLAIECDGKDIETIEGIADAGHPLIQSYIKNYALQCGYCTPGFIVTAKALLDKKPNPNEEEILQALAGNICRCSTYPKQVKSVMDAAAALRGGQ